MPYVVEPMQLEDIAEVAAIERQSFSTPWPVYAYRRELKENRNSRYFVVRLIEPVGLAEDESAQAAPAAEQAADLAKPPEEAGSAVRRAVSRFLPFLRQGASSRRPAVRRGTVVAYCGLWLVLDEGHITTIAVRPDLRGEGLGELMLIKLIETAQELGAERMTLEVRVSNEVAQRLYRKYTFKVEGVRRRYYSDDNEDANIMWSAPIASPEFLSRFTALRGALYKRLGDKLVRADVA